MGENGAQKQLDLLVLGSLVEKVGRLGRGGLCRSGQGRLGHGSRHRMLSNQHHLFQPQGPADQYDLENTEHPVEDRVVLDISPLGPPLQGR